MAIVWGAEYTYQANLVQRQNCCRIADNKFVIIYQNMGAGEGLAVVCSVVGNVITFGPPSQFTVGQLWQTEAGVCPLDTDKFAVAYHDTGMGNDGYARVGIVTGLNIAWGAAVEFQNNNTWYPTCCKVNTDKFGIVYTDRDNWDANVCICSVVSDVITAGAPVTFDGAGTETTSCISWDTDKFLIAYYRKADLSGELRVVTCAGLVPTCHAAAQFEAVPLRPGQFTNGLAKVDTDKFAISWRRGAGGADPNNAQCVRMGSIAGNIITLGPYYVLNPFPEYTNYINVEALTTNPAQFAVLYPNNAAGATLGHGTWNILEFTGTTITNFGAKQFFKAATIAHLTTANLLNGKLAVAFRDIVPVTGDGMIGVFLSLPTVTTDPATGVIFSEATLNGTLDDDGGEACDCGFEWGETALYGNTTPTQSRVTGETFLHALIGLTPFTEYHFRAFATNAAGTSYGADETFRTLGPSGTLNLGELLILS